ncbi:MAG TPA: molybdenum cofactor guanylyltransferase [Virgibacillus sp.]|nr:molybdenum cofactor guanylyltransferase [Virgibacillus sp.]
MHSCGVVLSGGKSSRMGTNKSLLQLNDDKPVIQHIYDEIKHICDDTIIVTNQPEQYDFLKATMVGDRYFDMGPLAGLETAMYHIDADIYMIAACDMPFINRDIYTYLANKLQSYDAVIPRFDNQMHPLAGIYRRHVLPSIQKQIQSHDLRVKGFFEDINVLYVDDFASFPQTMVERHFFNMNDPAEFEEAKRL